MKNHDTVRGGCLAPIPMPRPKSPDKLPPLLASRDSNETLVLTKTLLRLPTHQRHLGSANSPQTQPDQPKDANQTAKDTKDISQPDTTEPPAQNHNNSPNNRS